MTELLPESTGGQSAFYDWLSFTVSVTYYGFNLNQSTNTERKGCKKTPFESANYPGEYSFYDYIEQYGVEAVGELVMDSVTEMLGMDDVQWEQSFGSRGYGVCYKFDGICISTPSKTQPNVWFDISGSGCRAFETYGRGDWAFLTEFALRNGHITRLDVACDDRAALLENGAHEGILDIDTLYHDYCITHEYVSNARIHDVRCRWVDGPIDEATGKRTYISGGMTLYCGSEKSNVFIRIYDKAAEMHRSDELHWVRVELQLRDNRARQFLEMEKGIGAKFCGVMQNSLRFVDPSPDDSNRSRWPTKGYWKRFLDAAVAIDWPLMPGVAYNMERLTAYVENQAGNSIWAYLQLKGISGLVELAERKGRSILCDVDGDAVLRMKKRSKKYITVVSDNKLVEQKRLQKLLDDILLKNPRKYPEVAGNILGDVYLRRLFDDSELAVMEKNISNLGY